VLNPLAGPTYCETKWAGITTHLGN